MASSLRTTIARSKIIKFTVALGILLYGAFLFIGMPRYDHIAYPWKSEHGATELWRVQLYSETSKMSSKDGITMILKNGTNEEREPKPKDTKITEILTIADRTSNKTDGVQKQGPSQVQHLNKKCSKSLSSLTKYSKWFRDRYKPKVKMFLDKEDIGKYSKQLTRGLPYGFKGQNLSVFDQILKHRNFANPPIYGPSGRSGCVSCAVVGSGGILNGSGAGEEIDSHDFVFRLNRAVSKGRFAKDVGKRTAFYTFFPESQQLWEVEDKGMIAFYTMFKAYDVAYALKIIQEDKSPRYKTSPSSSGFKRPVLHPSKLKLVHPGFVNYVSETFLQKKARPTTGSIVAVLALHICDEVKMYGFGYDSRFSMHYYDSKFVKHTKKSTATHNVENERNLWLKLHEEGVIRLFKRDL